MEKQFFITVQGQAVQSQDLDLMGETAALADDRVLAELLRMAPMSGGDVAKAVLPSGFPGGDTTFGQSIVKPSVGAIQVAPFRAIVGSRTDGATDATKGWRDIRSAVFASSEDRHPGGPPKAPMLARIPIEVNGDGDPRWDLVYARVDVDLAAEGITRLYKHPTSMTVMPTMVAPYKFTKVTIGVEKGIAASSPTPPPVPPDAAGAYYIPLAYVRVQYPFSGGTVLTRADIWEVAPVVTLAQAVGGHALKPANGHYKEGGALVGAWPTTAGDRPHAYMPPTMVGGESRMILIEADKVPSGSVVDDSVDWRKRFFRITSQVNNTQPAIAPGVGRGVPSASYAADYLKTSLGYPETLAGGLVLDHNDPGITGSRWMLRADPVTGHLMVEHTDSAGCTFFAWLEASAPYEW